jgi:hypothetical protein
MPVAPRTSASVKIAGPSTAALLSAPTIVTPGGASIGMPAGGSPIASRSDRLWTSSRSQGRGLSRSRAAGRQPLPGSPWRCIAGRRTAVTVISDFPLLRGEGPGRFVSSGQRQTDGTLRPGAAASRFAAPGPGEWVPSVPVAPLASSSAAVSARASASEARCAAWAADSSALTASASFSLIRFSASARYGANASSFCAETIDANLI